MHCILTKNRWQKLFYQAQHLGNKVICCHNIRSVVKIMSSTTLLCKQHSLTECTGIKAFYKFYTIWKWSINKSNFCKVAASYMPFWGLIVSFSSVYQGCVDECERMCGAEAALVYILVLLMIMTVMMVMTVVMMICLDESKGNPSTGPGRTSADRGWSQRVLFSPEGWGQWLSSVASFSPAILCIKCLKWELDWK